MKRILLALTMAGLLLPFAPRAQADTEVSLDLLLRQPFVPMAVGSRLAIMVTVFNLCRREQLRLATLRRWLLGLYRRLAGHGSLTKISVGPLITTVVGLDLDSYGWVWVPGYEWGPAWVSWRTGGDYVGWAPLAARRARSFMKAARSPVDVDVQFDIGPLYYNFVDVRYIGEPVLRGRIVPQLSNVTIINRPLMSRTSPIQLGGLQLRTRITTA